MFACAPFGFGSFGRANPVNGSVRNTSLTPGIRTGQFNFNSNGTSNVSGAGAAGSVSNWFSIVQAGIGSSYWVRFTQTSNVFTTVSGLTSGTWTAIGAGVSLTLQNSGIGTEGIGDGTIELSPDGGTTIVSTGSVSWDVGYTP